MIQLLSKFIGQTAEYTFVYVLCCLYTYVNRRTHAQVQYHYLTAHHCCKCDATASFGIIAASSGIIAALSGLLAALSGTIAALSGTITTYHGLLQDLHPLSHDSIV